MSTDRRDLGRRVEGGKKSGTRDSIAAIDREAWIDPWICSLVVDVSP
jgi:hypothetical protein